ncbi:DUF711 family protein [Sulfuracidifex metallicus]|uniref:DUF711 family protein n=1 Tax=Sulfuracidifex metallicus TaxID=47303 RepID=UPI0006D093FA|nr:DUF711 family protein [Sulfuracidifex metallicus]
MFSPDEITEVIKMLNEEDLDIRSVTLSINTMDSIDSREENVISKLLSKIEKIRRFSDVVDEVKEKYGISIVTKRVSVSPVQFMLEPMPQADFSVRLAKTLEDMAEKGRIDYIGGFSAFADRGTSRSSEVYLSSLSSAMNSTTRVAGVLSAGSTFSGINLDSVRKFVSQIFQMEPHASSRTAVMVNLPPDSPFVPSSTHGLGMPDAQINVAVSGPGVIESAIRKSSVNDIRELHNLIKRYSFKVTRLGELVGREVSNLLGVPFGAVDLSLAPSPKTMDSVARVIESMGVEKVGGFGSLTALAILLDAVKKGGAMATSSVGGLSGAFIPVSEDSGMTEAALSGSLTFETLIMMSAVCNTGIDMVGVSRESDKSEVTSLILDELSLGLSLNKSLGVRLVPIDGKPGSIVDLGGLLGKVVIMPLKGIKSQISNMNGFIPNFLKRLEFG